MTETNPLSIVQAIVGAELKEEGHLVGAEAVPHGCVVTVSRDYGSGGLHLAESLARRLGVKCFDRELLDTIAELLKTDRYLMERLDEHVSSGLDDWARSIITGKSSYKEDYRRALVQVVVGIAKKGGILVGRGCHLILHQEDVFRVRISGSPERCAERLMQRLHMPIDQARREVTRVNTERALFINALFHAEWNDPSRYDLILNSDRFSERHMIDLILAAMERAGFPVPAEESPV